MEHWQFTSAFIVFIFAMCLANHQPIAQMIIGFVMWVVLDVGWGIGSETIADERATYEPPQWTHTSTILVSTMLQFLANLRLPKTRPRTRQDLIKKRKAVPRNRLK